MIEPTTLTSAQLGQAIAVMSMAATSCRPSFDAVPEFDLVICDERGASDELVRWIEGKLEEHGLRKVIPGKTVLEEAYRRQRHSIYLKQHFGELLERSRRHRQLGIFRLTTRAMG